MPRRIRCRCSLSIAGTAVLAIGTGWLASFRTLGQKPLEILRDE